MFCLFFALFLLFSSLSTSVLLSSFSLSISFLFHYQFSLRLCVSFSPSLVLLISPCLFTNPVTVSYPWGRVTCLYLSFTYLFSLFFFPVLFFAVGEFSVVHFFMYLVFSVFMYLLCLLLPLLPSFVCVFCSLHHSYYKHSK